MNLFSRSETAVERALIRRIQKLEKSTESLEEQTEIVRRRLKKHRRDIWKRKNRASASSTTLRVGASSDSWFLPDAEVFEQQQMESKSLNAGIVSNAQRRLYDVVPSKLVVFV
jgi:predicted transcriptional regulator